MTPSAPPSSTPPTPRRSRSGLLALALSLLLHGLALLWLTHRPAPTPAPAAARPMEWVIIEVPPARAPPAPTPPASPAPTAPRAPRPRPETGARPPPAQVAAPLVPPSAPAQTLASDVPRAAPAPAEPSRAAPGGLVLFPSHPRLELPAELPAQPSRGPRTVPEAPRALSVQEIASQVSDDVQGKARAELGAFHPYFTQLGQALLAAWRPEGIVRASAPQLAAQRGLSLHDAVNAYRERAGSFGRTGSALAGLDVGPPPPPSNGPLDAAAYTTGYVAMSAGMRAELEKKAYARVRLVQDREGRLVTLELLKPSAHPEVDRRALEDLRAAGQRLPVPPPDALGPRTRLVSTWELAVQPAAGGEKDGSSRTFVATLVGLGWNKRVRLLSGL